MRWPFRRTSPPPQPRGLDFTSGRTDAPAPTAAAGQPTPGRPAGGAPAAGAASLAPVIHAPPRPKREWAGLAPLARTIEVAPPLVAPYQAFQKSIGGAQTLIHTPKAPPVEERPTGLVDGVVRPASTSSPEPLTVVPGYSSGPAAGSGPVTASPGSGLSPSALAHPAISARDSVAAPLTTVSGGPAGPAELPPPLTPRPLPVVREAPPAPAQPLTAHVADLPADRFPPPPAPAAPAAPAPDAPAPFTPPAGRRMTLKEAREAGIIPELTHPPSREKPTGLSSGDPMPLFDFAPAVPVDDRGIPQARPGDTPPRPQSAGLGEPIDPSSLQDFGPLDDLLTTPPAHLRHPPRPPAPEQRGGGDEGGGQGVTPGLDIRHDAEGRVVVQPVFRPATPEAGPPVQAVVVPSRPALPDIGMVLPPPPVLTVERPVDVEPVPTDIRHTISTVHGVDVGDQPINRGPEVTEAARTFGRQAFTRDGQVHIPRERGSLSSPENRAMIAHELTHVAQQKILGTTLPSEDSAAGMLLEAQAQQASRAFSGEPGAPAPRPEVPLVQKPMASSFDLEVAATQVAERLRAAGFTIQSTSNFAGAQGFLPYDGDPYPGGSNNFAAAYVPLSSGLVPVPNFLNYRYGDAQKVLQDLNMQENEPRYDENASALPGTVVAQDPPATREGTPSSQRVTLTVAGPDPEGPPTATATQTAGGGSGVGVLGGAGARAQFSETDVTYSATGAEFREDFMSGLGAGFSSMFGGGSRTWRMPNVVGMSHQDAVSVLNDLGLQTIARADEDHDEPKDQVFEQDPAAGSDLPSSASERRRKAITLKTSTGDPPQPAGTGDDADDEDEAAAARNPGGARAARLVAKKAAAAKKAGGTAAAASTSAAAKKAAAAKKVAFQESDVVFSGTGEDFREEFSSALFGGGVGGFFGSIFGVQSHKNEFQVPDLSGKTKEEAQQALAGFHLPASKLEFPEEHHATIERNKVTKTEPAAGERIDLDAPGTEPNQKLKVYISKGPAPAPATTPDEADGAGGRRASQRGGDRPEDTLDMDVLINRLAPRLLTQLRRELQTGRDRAGINTRS